jgi:hypothetical protein
MQRDRDAIRRDVDPLDEQPEDPRLLGRVDLVPHWLERGDHLDELAYFDDSGRRWYRPLGARR